MSFNPFMIEKCAKLSPNIPRGLITEVFKQDEWPNISKLRCDKLTKISDYFTAGATFISHDHMDLKSDEVDRLKKKGQQYFVGLCVHKMKRLKLERLQILSHSKTIYLMDSND